MPDHRAEWLVGVVVMAIGAPSQAGIIAERLRCEYLSNPLGIDVSCPRLSWTVRATEPSARGQSQTAYRILVASAQAKLAQV